MKRRVIVKTETLLQTSRYVQSVIKRHAKNQSLVTKLKKMRCEDS